MRRPTDAQPVAQSATASGWSALARWLNQLRQSRGLSYRKMASTLTSTHTSHVEPYSSASLARAASGHPVRWPLVMAFTVACHGDVATAQRLWRKAVGAPLPAPDAIIKPEFITSPDQLLHAMRRIHINCGGPTLRDMHQRAKDGGYCDLLAPSTTSDILRGKRLPHPEYLAAFLRACAQPPHTWSAWQAALQRAKQGCRAQYVPHR